MLLNIEETLEKAFHDAVSKWRGEGLSEEEISQKVMRTDFSGIFAESIDVFSEHIYKVSNNVGDTVLQDAKYQKETFLSSMEEKWGTCFDLSELLYHTLLYLIPQYRECINRRISHEQQQEKQYTYQCIYHLFCRACQVYFEILCLVRNGFPEGAFARWRTMYEISCVAEFISKSGECTANAYFHDNSNCNLWVKTSPLVQNDKDLHKKPYITFSKIEKHCDFTQNGWNDVYRLSCLTIHANMEGTFTRNGIPSDRSVIPLGAVDCGIAFPVTQAAFTLRVIASIYFNIFPSADSIAYSLYVNKMSDKIYDTYLATETRFQELRTTPSN